MKKTILKILFYVTFLSNLLYASNLSKLSDEWSDLLLMGDSNARIEFLKKLKNKNLCIGFSGSLLNDVTLLDDFESIKYLLNNGANINLVCKGSKPVILQTLAFPDEIEKKSNKEVQKFLDKRIKIIQFLIKHGAKLTFSYYNGILHKNITFTYLHELVSIADDDKYSFMLLQKIYDKLNLNKYINVEDEEGETPIFKVYKNVQLLNFLISKGANLHHLNKKGWDILTTEVIYGGNKDIIEALIKRGLNVNAKDKRGATPLMFSKNLNTLKFLISKGAKLDVKTKYGNSVLGELLTRNLENVKYLINKGYKLNPNDKKYAFQMLLMPKKGYYKTFKYLVENRLIDYKSIKLMGFYAFSAIDWLFSGYGWKKDNVSYDDAIKIANYLFSLGFKNDGTINGMKGAYVNIVFHPLFATALMCNFEGFKYLIEKRKVNISEAEKKQKGIFLIDASEHACYKIISYTLKNHLLNYDINKRNSKGETALIALLKASSKLKQKEFKEKKENIIKTIELLLKNGININAKDNSGENVFDYAKKINDKEILKVLKSYK